MSIDFPALDWREVQLPCGLRALLVQDASASRCALAAGVQAGSLDEPAAWPGMAHFLEHAVFLGSTGWPQNGSFAGFIQGRGGRYNACTLACHTLFHLEVPPEAAAEALTRLLDQLLHPLLAAPRLLAERQVLDAEYRARCADPYSQRLAVLAACLSPQHPLAGFHHGQAASLPVEDDDFRAGLRAWHALHYRPAALRLLLCGPQSLDELESLLRQQSPAASAPFHPLQRHWPALWPAGQGAQQVQVLQSAAPRLALWLVLPPVAAAASLTALLERCLQSDHPGSLLAAWRTAGVARQLCCSLHEAGNALLLEIALEGGSAVDAAQARVLAAELRQWLQTLVVDATLAGSLVDSASARAALAWEVFRQPAMERATHWLLQWMQGGQPLQDGGAQLDALREWLAGWSPAHSLLLCSGPQLQATQRTRYFPVDWSAAPLHWPQMPAMCWLPAPLHPLQQALQTAAVDSGDAGFAPAGWLRRSVSGLRTGHAVLSLCWHAPAELQWLGLPARLTLDRAWQQEQAAARLLGCSALIRHDGPRLLLQLQGPQGLLALLAERLQQHWQQAVACWQDDWQQELTARDSGLLIRRLLLEGESPCREARQRLAACTSVQGMTWLQDYFAHATLAVLLQGAGRLPQLPGWGQPQALPALTTHSGRHWQQAQAQGEQAVILNWVAADDEPATRLHWLAIGTLLQAEFFQRLRVEQGLGYIVFSRFLQDSRGPLLQFGVQSPDRSAEALQQAIEDWLQDLPAHLARHTSRPDWRSTLRAALTSAPRWQRDGQAWLRGCDDEAVLALLESGAELDLHRTGG